MMMMMKKGLNLFPLNRSWGFIIQLEGIVPQDTPFARNFFSTKATLQPGDEEEAPSKIKVENVERVKTLLGDYGFTNTQVSNLFDKSPTLFTYRPERTLLPKLDFFRSIGFSNTDLAGFLSSNHIVLTRNLHNQIIPSYNFLKSFLVSDDKVVWLLKRDSRALLRNTEKQVAPNIQALREAGVPESRIVFLLHNAPKTLFSYSNILISSIKKAVEMGFSPSKLSFVRAVQVFSLMPEATWERKMEVLRGCGLSDAEILLAFRSCPHFVNCSDQKIVQVMDFLVKKMGWKPVDVVRNPALFSLSLEKRIVPRCMVLKALQAKGLVKENISLSTLLLHREDVFLAKFVEKYQDDVPDLMDIYLRRMGLHRPDHESKERNLGPV